MKTITELEKGCGRRIEAQYKHYIRGINCGEFWDRKGEKCYCPECEAKLQTLQQVCEEIKSWEKENKKVLKTEDIIKEKIIIADYVKWNKIRELLKKFQGEEE